jgi:hypothetical protein
MIKKFYAIIVLIFFSVLVKAQPDSLLKVYANQFQEERIFIHFDKTAYLPGETVWFKAYLMQGIELTDISKNFYVDFMNEESKLIEHFTAPIILSSAKGMFKIPDTYKSNQLFIKAYTSWMLNFDSAFLYHKKLPILQTPTATANLQAPATEMVFLPEGGHLVHDLKTRVAFKATTTQGLPIYAKGALYNNKNVLIDSVETIHNGMGFFNIIPIKGESYAVQWRDEFKVNHTTILPTAQEAGVAMKLDQKNKKLYVAIARQTNASENYKLIRIVATIKKQVVYRSNIKLHNNNEAVAVIPVDGFPSGIIQITLFDINWMPLAERICFIKNDEFELLADARLFRPNFSPKAKNTIEINIPDTITTNLSVAVTDAVSVQANTENMISSMLLTTEIKGYVHEPMQYFLNDADSTNQNLDLVLLTNGWRNIRWQDIAINKLPVIQYPKDSAFLSIEATMLGTRAGIMRDAGDMNLIIKTKDSAVKFLSLPMEQNGKFLAKDLVFFDTATLYYQFNKNKDIVNVVTVTFDNLLVKAKDKILLNNFFAAPTKIDTNGLFRRNQLWEKQLYLDKLLETTTLEGVTVKAKTKTPAETFEAKYASGLFRGGDGYFFDMMNNTGALGAIDIFSYLQGRVAGMMIQNSGSETSVRWRGGDVKFFLDEMPVDATVLKMVSVRDMAYVKVLRPPFMGAPAGAIAVYTRKAEDATPVPGKSLEHKKIAGYTYIKEFYAPNYDKQPELKFNQDVRTTLYWNPFVILDKKNRTIQLSFFNNDVSKKLRINIQGFNMEGKLVSIEKLVQ